MSRRALAVAALVAAVGLAACGGDDKKSPASTATTASTAKTATNAKLPKKTAAPASRPPVSVGKLQTVTAPAGGGRPATVLAVKVAQVVDPVDATPFQSKARAEIPPGKRQRGCITLILRKGERVRTVQFAPGGAGALSAEWTAKRKRR